MYLRSSHTQLQLKKLKAVVLTRGRTRCIRLVLMLHDGGMKYTPSYGFEGKVGIPRAFLGAEIENFRHEMCLKTTTTTKQKSSVYHVFSTECCL